MSNSDDLQQRFAVPVRVLQIIVGALTLGVAIFLGAVFFAIPPGNPPDDPLLIYAACAEGTCQTVQTGAAPVDDASTLCAVYQTRTIIAAAILEGAAFFAATAYQQHRDPLTLSIAVVLTLMIGLHLPTRTRVVEWVEDQLVRLADDRQAEQLRR